MGVLSSHEDYHRSGSQAATSDHRDFLHLLQYANTAAGRYMDFGTNSWQAHFGSRWSDHGTRETDTSDHYRPTYTRVASRPLSDSYWPQYANQPTEHGLHDSYHPQDTRQTDAQPTWTATVQGGRITKAKGGRGGIAAALVREGEVIGAKATPIGSNSVGRRLLAKMGWSEGTALGKHRDGRLAPVEQVMRFSHTKTGLQ